MRNSFQLLSLLLASLLALPAVAMVAMDEHEMAGVSGQGIAIALDDFSFRMAPTSFIELTGTNTALANWRRGDVRFFGLSMTSAGAGGTNFNGSACAGDLSCPIGSSGIANFAPVFNPLIVRVFQFSGFNFQGVNLTGATRPTVLEILGPTKSDPWRWSFWGEIETGRGTASPALLQSQTMILGKPISFSGLAPGEPGRPTLVRLMRVQNSADPTFGITGQIALSGDFRFSVAQTSASPDQITVVPEFESQEGLHFKNVDSFLPLGRLHHQAITFDNAGTNGNFIIELTRLPDVAAVYNDFYNDASAAGHVRWGNFDMNIAGNSITNGMFFRSPGGGSVVNLGTARIEGIQMQHLKITSLGAGI